MSKRKCDRCERLATCHSVEIVKGQKIEKHLCDAHAEQDNLVQKPSAHTPINELLTNFVKIQGGGTQLDVVCPECKLTFAQFREASLLGCPNCYMAFEPQLAPLLERAHESATHHVGKVPRRAGSGEQRQAHLQRLQKRLDEAVAAEDYRLAARLRDEIRRFEEPAT